MPEKCYPCLWTNLLPMYLDYTEAGSNKALQRRPRSTVLMLRPIPFAAPLNAGVRWPKQVPSELGE